MPKLARSAWILVALAPVTALVFATVSACVGDDVASTGGAGEDGGVAQDGSTTDGTSAATDTGAGASDSGGPCSPTGAFGDPVEVPGLHVPGSSEKVVRFSDDGLSAVILRTPNAGDNALYLADRATADVDFGPGTQLSSEVNGDGGVGLPGAATFADAKATIYFEAKPMGTGTNVYAVERASAATTTFGPRMTVTGLSGFGDHAQPYFVNDKMYLFFNSGFPTPPPEGIYVAARDTDGGFPTVTPLANLETFSFPVVTRDELTIFVSDGSRVYQASRASAGVAFGVPVELPPSVSTGHETPSDVSVDGCTLYFTRVTGAEGKLFKTTRGR